MKPSLIRTQQMQICNQEYTSLPAKQTPQRPQHFSGVKVVFFRPCEHVYYTNFNSQNLPTGEGGLSSRTGEVVLGWIISVRGTVMDTFPDPCSELADRRLELVLFHPDLDDPVGERSPDTLGTSKDMPRLPKLLLVLSLDACRLTSKEAGPCKASPDSLVRSALLDACEAASCCMTLPHDMLNMFCLSHIRLYTSICPAGLCFKLM